MKRFALLASLAVGIMLVVACGGGEGDSGAVSTPALADATAIPTTAPPPPDTGPDPALIAEGQANFGSCSACHGQDARGVPGLGKDLVESAFIDSLTDAELVAFIKVGRGPSDEGNTTGLAMPPKGGNPSLSDDDLTAIVAYINSLK